MSFVKGTLLVAGGAAIGGVVAATATAKAIADYVKSDEFWDEIRHQHKAEYPCPVSTELVFESRRDTDKVLDELEGVINSYGVASVADFYDLAGEVCRTYSANVYGWTDIRTAKVVRVREGYIIQLPRTVQI